MLSLILNKSKKFAKNLQYRGLIAKRFRKYRDMILYNVEPAEISFQSAAGKGLLRV